ncbi:hypothetical protein [Hespellia stercorisuis]|uniref:2'-5' RNA ligase n=1 Tax=Hespellia stercorisuis DSM 15480 TaxID=1121950 RepID=A0A1M6U8L1_9FIRM|nr:hypothetical protein [Hespellia stercorisuis]SHK65408.1 hypothetical protein SAMN02745243_03433 [Hespellia stercorisuis DSM 15480]
MYLISIYFDNRASQKLQRQIDLIAERTGNIFMTENRVPPHMTISQIEARNVDVLVPYMESLKGKLGQGDLQFVSVGMLLPYVLYAAPVMNAYLLGLSGQVFDVFSGIPETAISKYYQPMSWLPHVTLGKTLSKEQMTAAVQAMQEGFAPFRARAMEIGLAKVNPHEDVVRFKL